MPGIHACWVEIRLDLLRPYEEKRPDESGRGRHDCLRHIMVRLTLELALKPRRVSTGKAAAVPSRWRFVADTVCRAGLVLWIWAVMLVVRIHPAAAGLDHSGTFMFNYAHVHGLVFGRDVAFTYGPLSFLTQPMPLGHNIEYGVWFQIAIWAIFAAATGWLIFGRRPPLGSVALCALGLYLGSGAFREFGYAGPDMFLVTLGLVLLGGALTGSRWMLWFAGASAVCTLVFFVKFSSALTLGGAMAIFTAALLLADRAKAWRAAVLLLAVPMAIFLVHVVCYGSPAWLVRYVRVAMEMGSAYGVVMGEGSDTAGLRTAILIMIVWLAGAAVLYWRRVPSWPLAAAALGPLFVEFKHAFAREAGHIEIFFTFVALLAGIVALFTQVRRRDLAYVGVVFVALAGVWYSRESPRVRGLADPLKPLANLRVLRQAMHPSEMRRVMEAVSAQGLAQDRLPPELLARVGRASIAVFPVECAYAGANEIALRPLPVFQAYQAYTPYLDEWNAAFLGSDDAPRFILFDWETVDGRHPLLDGPATAVAMFRNYEFDSMYGRHMLLRRRQKRFGAINLVERRQQPLAEPVRLPASDHPSAARIHLRWNFAGRLLKFFFRVPEVRLMASTSAGRVLNARVPPDVLADGVPNFLPIDMDAARVLFGGTSPGRIDALLVGGPGSQYLEPTVQIEIDSSADITLPAAVPPLPALDALQDHGTTDTWRIEMLNETEAGAFTQVTVPDNRGYVRVQGWAVLKGAAAGGVVVMLDGRPYPAEYGTPRPDVGALFHAGGPLDCGFEWSVPAWNLGKTWHELAVTVLTPDRTGFYAGNRTLRFKME
jgi:hypothetical protein